MRSSSIVSRVLRSLAGAAASRRGDPRADAPSRRRIGAPTRGAGPGDGTGAAYPGDFTGTVHPTYQPELDGEPDPGEIVWTWVPYEEDHTRGKDRPVLVVGHDGPWLLVLMLTSRDHDSAPGRPGEVWLDLGTGEWDRSGRPSEVRLDRVIRIDPDAVRREGAILDRSRFDQVAAGLNSPRARGG